MFYESGGAVTSSFISREPLFLPKLQFLIEMDYSNLECPQFVDFTEVDSSPKDANNEFGGFSPVLGNAAVPLLNIRAKNPQTQLYPDRKQIARVQQTPAAPHLTNATDSDKWCRTALSKRLSKSEGALYRPFPILKGHNKSLSENEIRGRAVRKCPTTPVCLKRTLYRAKVKKLKTSEELELEKIAQLQQQMREHLRANEMTMKRLKMKPKPLQREVNRPELKSRNCFKVNVPKVADIKDLGQLNVSKQNPSIQVKSGWNQLFSDRKEIVRVQQTPTSYSTHTTDSDKGGSTSLSSSHLLCKKPYRAHPGLVFLPKQQKMPTLNFGNLGKESVPVAPQRGYPETTPLQATQKGLPIKEKRNAPGASYNFTGKENNSLHKLSSLVKRGLDYKLRTPFQSKDNRI